jgi:hypothetical protein
MMIEGPVKIDITQLYSLRLVVFLETEPQGCKYRQVLFTKEQYKHVLDVIRAQFPKPTIESKDFINLVTLEVGDELVKLPDEIKNFKL